MTGWTTTTSKDICIYVLFWSQTKSSWPKHELLWVPVIPGLREDFATHLKVAWNWALHNLRSLTHGTGTMLKSAFLKVQFQIRDKTVRLMEFDDCQFSNHISFFFLFLPFVFLGPRLWHMEVPRLGV